MSHTFVRGEYVKLAHFDGVPFIDVESVAHDFCGPGISASFAFTGTVIYSDETLTTVKPAFGTGEYTILTSLLRSTYPVDLNGVAVCHGQRIALVVKKELKTGVVDDIGKWKHHGCGWIEAGVTVILDETGKKITNFFPKQRMILRGE
jgi:hypothetical protein